MSLLHQTTVHPSYLISQNQPDPEDDCIRVTARLDDQIVDMSVSLIDIAQIEHLFDLVKVKKVLLKKFGYLISQHALVRLDFVNLVKWDGLGSNLEAILKPKSKGLIDLTKPIHNQKPSLLKPFPQKALIEAEKPMIGVNFHESSSQIQTHRLNSKRDKFYTSKNNLIFDQSNCMVDQHHSQETDSNNDPGLDLRRGRIATPIYQNLYTPVYNQASYAMLLKQALQRQMSIEIRLTPEKQLKKRKNILVAESINFMDNGDFEGLNEPCGEDLRCIFQTTKNRYRGHEEVHCAFCHKSSRNVDATHKLGAFYGPFKRKKYVHIVCVIWCRMVYVDNTDDQLKNIDKEIVQAQKDRCFYCGKMGAGLKCHASDACEILTHYECGLGKCDFNWHNYTFFCHKCKLPDDQEKDSE